jgi:hypothetical protein
MKKEVSLPHPVYNELFLMYELPKNGDGISLAYRPELIVFGFNLGPTILLTLNQRLQFRA